MSQHERHSADETYESVHEWFYGKDTDDGIAKQYPEVRQPYGIAYKGSYTDSIQIVKGGLRSHHTEMATIVDKDGVEWTIMGNGLADREPGEIVRRKDGDRRKMGEFEYAFRLAE